MKIKSLFTSRRIIITGLIISIFTSFFMASCTEGDESARALESCEEPSITDDGIKLDCIEGITVDVMTKLDAFIQRSNFLGIYVGVWYESDPNCDSLGKSGERFYCVYTFDTYKKPDDLADELLLDLKERYHSNDAVLVHIKYFIQACTDNLRSGSGEVNISTADNPCGIFLELWSEYNLNPQTGEEWGFGYPFIEDGGARLLSQRWVHLSAGFPYHSPYPKEHIRSFGSTSETGEVISIASNPWHQFAIDENNF